jgi:hypothetical protein
MVLSIYIRGNTEYKLMRLSQLLLPESVAAWMGSVVDSFLHERIRQRFENEGDDAAGRWRELAQSTQAIRAQMGYGAEHPINVRTGELQNYIEGTPGRVVPDPVGATLNLPGKPAGNVDLQDKYRVAQQGFENTPPRPVLALSEKDLVGVMGELEAYIRVGLLT